MIYGVRSNGGKHGTVYTKETVVEFMLGMVLQGSSSLLNKIIVEPSAGDGSFAIPIVKRIIEEVGDDADRLKKELSNLYLYEIDPDVIDQLKNNLLDILPDNELLDSINIEEGDYLLLNVPVADIIIGNPPYVRFDNIPRDKKEYYKRLFFTFTGRADIYVPFIEKSLKSLSSTGSVVFICADRWINNRYGSKLRKFIKNNFQFEHFIKFSDFNPFREEVIAYPSVFQLSGEKRNDEICITEVSSEDQLKVPFSSSINKTVYFNTQAEVEYDNYSLYLSKIEAEGFKIGIGVATGADRIFITRNPELVEEECLIPLVMRKDLTSEGINWQSNYLINTYDKNGRTLVDIKKYPLLDKYLTENEETLRKRHVAKRNKDNWFKMIDPIKPELQNSPKLLIPDISRKRNIVLDEGGFYPHHNLYYITSNCTEDLLVLRSLLLSDLVIKQVEEKGTVMNGGALRWQAQTLRKLYIPSLISISPGDRHLLISSYQSGNFDEINRITSTLFSQTAA